MNHRKTYRQMAKKYGIRVSELKREMQAAIHYAYQNPPDDGVTKAVQNKVPCKGDVPTVDEFITYMAQEVKKRK